MEKFCKKEFNFEEPVYLNVWITVYVKKIVNNPSTNKMQGVRSPRPF